MDERPESDVVRDRAEARLEERSRELALLEALGRRAAEARSPRALFASTVRLLHDGDALDLALVAEAVDGPPEITVFVGRPFAPACVDRLAARAGALLGWTAEARTSAERTELTLEGFEAARGERSSYDEAELEVVPVLRHRRAVACLLLLPAGGRSDARLRLLFSAGNHLGLNLDRLLGEREAMAERFRTILDSMPQAVVLTDMRDRVAQANRAAGELFETLGLAAEGPFAPAAERLALGPLLEQARGVGEGFAAGEITLDGRKTFTVTISPYAAPGDGRGGLVVVLADVTESRRLERQLAQSERMSSLGQLISGVAHELNNPLSSVIGYAQLLRTSVHGDEKVTTRLEVLEREAGRCQRIVRDLLAFARRREPQREVLSLNEVVQGALGLLRYGLRTSGIEVATELDPQLPAIAGDRHQLQQALVNLVTNAQQAIRETGRRGKVRVTTRREGSEVVVLEVADDGPGIPEALRDRIFDPFFTTKAEGQGTGLGLSIVFGIVQAHDGALDAGPAPEGGALFRLRLPGAPRASDLLPEAERAASAQAPVSAGRVLVVDDEQEVARLIRDALEADGHQVETVHDGAEALARLERAEFDVIVSDLRMPGMDAVRLVEELGRRRPEWVRRVIVTTGDTMSPEPEQLVARAGLELLPKPFDLDLLRRRVRDRLARR